MLKIVSMPWKTFYISTIFLYCYPCLSTGSKEYYLKKREKKVIFFVFRHLIGDMYPKKSSFFLMTQLP